MLSVSKDPHAKSQKMQRDATMDEKIDHRVRYVPTLRMREARLGGSLDLLSHDDHVAGMYLF